MNQRSTSQDNLNPPTILLLDDLDLLLDDSGFLLDFPTLTEKQILEWADSNDRLQAWQALLMILVPDFLLNQPRNLRLRHSISQKQIQNWFKEEKRDNTERRIARNWIPYLEVYIPDTPDGQRFYQIASAIGQIPLQANVVPRTQDQIYWFKTLHYFYQAIGILLAQLLHPLEINDINNNLRLLQYNLPDGEFERVERFVNVSHKEIQLIAAVFDHLRNRLPYLPEQHSFDDYLEFFIKMRTEQFRQDWERSVNNRTRLSPQIWHEEREEIWTISPLLDEMFTQEKESNNKGKDDNKDEVKQSPHRDIGKSRNWCENIDQWLKEQTGYFEKQGLYGQLMLTIKDLAWNELDLQKQNYCQAIDQARSDYHASIFWLYGYPQCKHKPLNTSNTKTTKTKERRQRWRPIQGTVDCQGYITWQFTDTPNG